MPYEELSGEKQVSLVVTSERTDVLAWASFSLGEAANEVARTAREQGLPADIVKVFYHAGVPSEPEPEPRPVVIDTKLEDVLSYLRDEMIERTDSMPVKRRNYVRGLFLAAVTATRQHFERVAANAARVERMVADADDR